MFEKKFTFIKVQEYLKDLGLSLLKYDIKTTRAVYIDNDGYLYQNTIYKMQTGQRQRIIDSKNPFVIYNIKLYLLKNYKNRKLVSEKFINEKTKIILTDNNGYLYTSLSGNLLKKEYTRLVDVANKYSIHNLHLWLKYNNKNFKLLSNEYKGCDAKLLFKCNKENCGELFEMSWHDISQGNECPFCSGKQVGLSNCLAIKNHELAKEFHPTLNGKLTPYNITPYSNKKVWWQCSKNPKHIWRISVGNRMNERNCPYCSGKLPSEDYNLLVYNPKICEEWDYERNKKKPQEYCPNGHEKVWWKCKECGNKWDAVIANRNYGMGCPQCAETKGEKEIRNVLYKYIINYDFQKTFDGLIGLGGGNLSYDFYLLDYNLLIEYQGQFHDGNGNYYIKQNLKKQQEHDKRKRDYAKNNNIRLLEIWYWDFDRIEEILLKELQLN
jgi:hypothetical protein